MTERQILPPSSVVRSEELRFALVMNGGVSLAVWMGGVSFEINRLVRETHPVFRGLLELTRISARVDVISGTSAGGVNGAALALAQVYDRSVYSLRQVWMERGAFSRLLRDPAQANPPSLLDGDGFYLPALEDAFAALAGDGAWRIPPAAVPITLSLTATMLRGERKLTVDDLGAAIEDARHRTTFDFVRMPSRPDVPERDGFATPQQIAMLARAARTTSSFPIAFEPVFWKPADFAGVPGVTAAVASPRFLVDGGLVDNKPFEGALEAIFRMPCRSNVRRVLAYIAPDPSVSAATADDVAGEPPLMAEVASRSLIGIPSSESISEQLDRIREHNRGVFRRRDALVGLARFRAPAEIEQLARSLFPVYHYRRLHGIIDLFAEKLEEIAAVAAEARADNPSYETQIGRKTIAWLRSALEEDEGWASERIPQDVSAIARAMTVDAERWEWGIYTIEFLRDFMFDVLRRVQRLRYLMPAQGEAPPGLAPWPQPPGTGWEALDDRKTWQTVDGVKTRGNRVADEVLGSLWDRAFAISAEIDDMARNDRYRVSRWAGSMIARLIAEPARLPDEERLARRARVTAAAALHFSHQRDYRWRWNELALEIGRVLQALAAPVWRIDAGAGGRQLARAEGDSWRDLQALARALGIEHGTPQAIVRAALCFEVIHYAMSHRERGADVQVELVQISGNSKSPLSDETLAARKLAGMQLAHFGAFYKMAWRANDWMMGRLDGVERLLPVVLNAERLYCLYVEGSWDGIPASLHVARLLRDIALSEATADVRARVTDAADVQALADELAFLDKKGARVPETLPRCCALLTLRLHLEIVCSEMPLVARAARDDETAGADSQGVSSQVANQVLASNAPAGAPVGLTLEHALALFAQKRIGGERIRDEVGSDLFTKTVAQTIAVTHAAAVGEAGGLTLSLRAFLKTLGVPILLFYWLAGRLVGASRTSAAIGAAALAVAATIGVLALVLPSDALKPAAAMVRFSWVLLGVCLLVLMLRGPQAFIVLAVALALPLALHYAASPPWAVVAGTVEVAGAWIVGRWLGIRGLGIVIVMLLAALIGFPDETTRHTLENAVCQLRRPPVEWIGRALDHFLLLPDCNPPYPIAPTLPLLLAFLLFFVTIAGFLRGSPWRAIARRLG